MRVDRTGNGTGTPATLHETSARKVTVKSAPTALHPTPTWFPGLVPLWGDCCRCLSVLIATMIASTAASSLINRLQPAELLREQ